MFRPPTLSCTASRALRIKMGTLLFARARRQTSIPESPGSMRSSTITSGWNSSKCSNAAAPSGAPLASIPRPCKPIATRSTMCRSSSTTSTRGRLLSIDTDSKPPCSGGEVVLHGARLVRQDLRATSLGEQATDFIVSVVFSQDHDAASPALCGIRFQDGPRVRGFYQLPDLQFLERGRGHSVAAHQPEDLGLVGYGEVALVSSPL